jgi:inhibitor of cysteine peptidase
MATVVLNQGNNGERVRLRLGDEIALRLPENATTGYRWHTDRAEGVVEEETSTSESSAPSSPPDERNPVVGRGGLRAFHFRTSKAGPGRLALSYYREWEGEGSAIDTFAVDLDVIPR